jgi:hypothetical protein
VFFEDVFSVFIQEDWESGEMRLARTMTVLLHDKFLKSFGGSFILSLDLTFYSNYSESC